MAQTTPPPVDTFYYDILQIPTDADYMLIKKAYKKFAIKYHPDKNKEPDAEEKFKAISEAYQVLGSAELRAKYDRHGRNKDLPPEGGFADGRTCFRDMYGGQGFKDVFGDLNLATLLSQDDHYYSKEQKPPARSEEEKRRILLTHVEQQQEHRVKTLVTILKDILSHYSRPQQISSLAKHNSISTSSASSTASTPSPVSVFEEHVLQQANKLKTEPYGNSLLCVVGRLYTAKAREYLGLKCGRWPSVYYALKEKKYVTKELWRTIQSHMDAQTAGEVLCEAEENEADADEIEELDELLVMKSYQALWQMVKFEIEATLRSVCDTILQDKTVNANERIRQAEALLSLGTIYMTTSEISENEDAIVQLKCN